MYNRRVKFGLKIPNRLGKTSEKFRGDIFDSDCALCLRRRITMKMWVAECTAWQLSLGSWSLCKLSHKPELCHRYCQPNLNWFHYCITMFKFLPTFCHLSSIELDLYDNSLNCKVPQIYILKIYCLISVFVSVMNDYNHTWSQSAWNVTVLWMYFKKYMTWHGTISRTLHLLTVCKANMFLGCLIYELMYSLSYTWKCVRHLRLWNVVDK